MPLDARRKTVNRHSPKILKSILAALFLTVLLAYLTSLCGYIGSRSSGALKITVIDVGQGDSILIESPSGKTMLIDGGDYKEEEDGARDFGISRVLPYLRSEGVNKIDYMLATHPHSDHVGGLPAVMNEIPVAEVFDANRLPFHSVAYSRFLQSAGNRRRRIAQGDKIDLGGGVHILVLNPPQDSMPYGCELDNDTVNNYSAVLLVEYGKTRFLLDGDAEEDAEGRMIRQYSGRLKVDMLKCGHHGSDNATSDEWLGETQPKWAAISCGQHNVFGHPNPATLARLASHGVRILRTDLGGMIVFTSDGATVTAQSQRSGIPKQSATSNRLSVRARVLRESEEGIKK
jgi:beta-lactamase superfamily II metal-dependent hydrolase